MRNGKYFELTQERDYKVVKGNEIIQKARYDLNITELKAFAFILSKVKPTDEKGQYYDFCIKEYCQVVGIDYKNGGNYKQIKQTLQNLRDKSFWMTNENGEEVVVGWLEKAKLHKGSGKIKVRLDEDIQKYVIGLFDNFTQYSLISTLPMKSSYSFRLFELLKSYAFQKQHTFDIDDLKIKLSATHYSNFKDFRKKVIEIAVKEINEYTEIETTWEPIYKGRKVESVLFNIKQRDTWERIKANYRASEQLEGQTNIYDYLPEKTHE